MILFTIDNIQIEVDESTTILEAAKKLGISIPTLCHAEHLRTGGSCMVCAVKNLQNKRLIPSCVAKCKDNLVIDASSEEMVEFRTTLLHLILSEHRGECIAPCQKVCPQQVDIPRVMYHVAAGNVQEAKKLVAPCGSCNKRCEKACRRKQVDKNLSIYDIVNSLWEGPEEKEAPKKNTNYAHALGAVSDTELDHFKTVKFFEDELKQEASRCLGCGCFANEDCQLQRLATSHKIKGKCFAASKKEFRREFFGEICYEVGKCIKCMNCVEIGRQHKDGEGPTLLHRGIDLEIGAPIGVDAQGIFAGIEQECVAACPTGALFWHRKNN